MKNSKKFWLCFLLLLGLCATTIHGSVYNSAESVEVLQYQYHGHVQIKASFNDGGKHAKRGYLRYKNNKKDSGRQYTATAKSKKDSQIYHRYYIFKDTLNPFAPKTQFYYGFIWF